MSIGSDYVNFLSKRFVNTHAHYQDDMVKDRFGLLVRCNPKMWKWHEQIPSDGSEVEIDWTCKLNQALYQKIRQYGYLELEALDLLLQDTQLEISDL